MKKLLFTAVAAVGFSTISLANNQAEVIEVKTVAVAAGDPCGMARWAAEDECLANGCDATDTFYRGASEWGNCMSETGIWG